MKIVGVAIPSDGTTSKDSIGSVSYAIFSDNILESIFTEDFEDPGIYSFAVAKMPKKRSEIGKIVSVAIDESGKTKYTLQNSINGVLLGFKNEIKTVSRILFYSGLVVAVFAVLLFSNFIATSVTHKKKEIGILRALGARSADVFRVFFSEAFLIAAFCFVVSTVITFLANIAANYYLRYKRGILVTLLTPGIRQVVLLLAVSIGVAAVASFLPIYKFARKKPIDTIREI